MKLKEFVEICNKCDYKFGENPWPGDSAYKLAKDFDAFTNWEETSKQRVLDFSKDDYEELLSEMNLESDEERKENLAFYMCLRRREEQRGQFADGYEFLWDKDVKAKINVWEPFSEDGILSQKWHVLVSLLAFLDTAANDNYFISSGGRKRYSYCKQLIDITSAYDDCKPNKDQKGKETLCTWIDYSKNGYRHRRRFPSMPMNQWLQEAIQGGK